MNKKALIFGGGAIAVVAIVVALIFIFTGGEDAYRSIKVFEIDGTCKVERDGDTLDAFKNMALSSGDTLTVGDGSFTRLKLDDDKYVYLEANTKIKLNATGTANDSKTTVFIERGSMLTEVKKKLSATSSYDIVTPNTTMSIRGTKTLTEVIEDVVTGNVQTSNAVLEGQVKIKAVKVKADGTVVSVERDLGAGEGNAFKSAKEELVSQEEMQAIAETGASVSGIKVEIVSEEDADVVFDVATFEASFLENVKNILVADAQAETGEEGLSQEQIDAINAQLDEVLESFDVISTESQNAINAAASGEIEPEPTPEITPEPTPEATSYSLWSWENIAVTETEDTQDEGPTLVDGDTNLVVIDDTDEADDTADRDNGADEVATEDDDNDDAADEDGEEADETDEDEVSDEDDNAGEDDVDDADDADDEDKSDEEGEEENIDEEDADKEDGEDEEAEDEESEEEPKDESEETPAEQTTQSTPSSGSGTSTGGTTETSRMSYNDTTTTVEYSFGSNQQTVSVPVKVSFYTGDENNKQRISMNSLPTTSLQPGNALPGCMWSDYKAEIVPATSAGSGSHANEEVGYFYSFTGWYASEADAASNDLSKRYVTYSTELANVGQLYPGICRTAKLSLVNSDPYAGYVQFPIDESCLTGNIISWEPIDGGVQAVVKAGATISLPIAETRSNTDSIDHAYVNLKQPHALMFCYVKHDYSSQVDCPDIVSLYLDGTKPASAEGASMIYYASDNPTITIGENDEYIELEMYYVAPVEVRVADFESGIVNVKKTGNPSSQTESLGRFYAAATQNSSISEPIVELPGVNNSTYRWKLTKTSEAYTIGGEKYDLYTFKTAFSQAYGHNLGLPQLSMSATQNSGSYKKEFLSAYRTKDNKPVTTFITNENDEPMAIDYLWDYPSIDPLSFDTLADFDGRYIFTVQPVDWIYINMNPDCAPTGVTNKVFKVGENHPYVIPDSRSESTKRFKFAVNPIDMFTESGATPSMPFNYEAIVGLTGSPSMEKFVFAPDDVVYPFVKLGNKRTNDIVDDPVAVYGSTLTDVKRSSYAYIGVQGYKLAGYKVQRWDEAEDTFSSNTNFDYWINAPQTGFSGDYKLSDHPCTLLGSQNDSVMNKLDLTLFDYYYYFSGEPFIFTPVFVPVAPVTVELVYNEPANVNNLDRGPFESKYNGGKLQYYYLKLNGVDAYSLSEYVDLSSLKLDLYNAFSPVDASFSFHLRPIDSSIRIDSENKLHVINYGGNDSEIGSEYYVFDTTSRTLTIRLDRLYARPDDDPAHAEVNWISYDGSSSGSAIYVRGLIGEQDSSAVSLLNYAPKLKITPAAGQAYRYSIFMELVEGAVWVSRVFDATTAFVTRTGMSDYECMVKEISDYGIISGSDGYDDDYNYTYGMFVRPDWYTPIPVVHTDGSAVSADELTTLREGHLISPKTIKQNTILGTIGYEEYVGVFVYNKVNKIAFDNPDAVYCFKAVQSGNTLMPQMKEENGNYVPEVVSSTGLEEYCRFRQYTIPDGFVLIELNQSPYTDYLVYVGNAGKINVLQGQTTAEFTVGTEHVARYRYILSN